MKKKSLTLHQKITARGALATRGFATPANVGTRELVCFAGRVFRFGISTCFGFETAKKFNLVRNRDGKPVKNTFIGRAGKWPPSE